MSPYCTAPWQERKGGEDNAKPGHYREYMVQGTEQASDTTRYDEAATEYAPSDDPIWLQRDDQLATAILAGMQSVL